jgi:N-acetylmuramoyl-L-alanine amidase
MPERHRRRAARPVVSVSLERRRALQWLVLPIAQLVPLSASASAQIASTRLWPALEYTRVILEGPGPIPYRVAAFRDPLRVVLDLDDVEMSSELELLPFRLQATDPYIGAIRLVVPTPGSVRLVFDLKTEARPQSFALAPVAGFGYRIVLDLYPVHPVDPLMALLDEKASAPALAPKPPAQSPGPPAESRSDGRKADRRKIVVAIDPGHGGEDPGAIGQRGTHEKDVVLAIARKLKARIDAEPGMRAALTRDDDYYVPLATRVRKAQALQADLFVSIHADAFRERSARGSSVFALSEHGATSAAAKWLAQKENAADLIGGVSLDARDPIVARTLLDLSQTAQISDSLKVGRHVLDGIGTVNPLHRGAVEQAGFAVLKAPDIPSILVETAFISNPDEEQKLRSDRYQTQLAQSIHDGIKRYFASNPPLARTRPA